MLESIPWEVLWNTVEEGDIILYTGGYNIAEKDIKNHLRNLWVVQKVYRQGENLTVDVIPILGTKKVFPYSIPPQDVYWAIPLK